jgi:ubiquinone biosynthesis accessory factor UbiJ
MQFESPIVAALNHLLGSEPWARERLAPFAGEGLELRAPPLPALRFLVATDGRMSAAGPATEAKSSLVITLGPGALAAAAKGEEHLLREIQVEGNARFASEVMFLLRHLRWDAEEDLARIFGDAAAHRAAGMVRGAVAWHADAARRIAEAFVEYATEEKPLLVRRGELRDSAALLAQLRDGLERLEKRLERVERPGG